MNIFLVDLELKKKSLLSSLSFPFLQRVKGYGRVWHNKQIPSNDDVDFKILENK